MTPTIQSTGYNREDTPTRLPSSVRQNCPAHNSHVSNNFNNSDSSQTDPHKYQAIHESRDDSGPGAQVRVQSRARLNATSYTSKASNESTRENDPQLKEALLSTPALSAAPRLMPKSDITTKNHIHHNGTTDYGVGDIQQVSNGQTHKELTINHHKDEPRDMAKTPSSADSFTGQDGKSRTKVGEKFFLTEPCLYTHIMFVRAAKIFEFLMQHDDDDRNVPGGKPGLEVVGSGDMPDINFEHPREQMTTFELTFATLKFQVLFRAILEQTGFFTDFPSFIDDYGLVCIILFDLQSRKFQKRKPFPAEQIDELCLEIEDALLSKKTRLQSFIAKERIKYSAPSIEFLVPEQIRDKDETKTKTPVYLWVNQMKTTLDDTIVELEAEGFERLVPGEDISEQTSRVFQVDEHCHDLLVFPPHLDMYFKDTPWVKAGHLVQQDKSSCLAPQSVYHLLGIDQDVIHVNVGSGITTAHLASLLRHKSPHSHVWGFGVDSPEKAKKAARNLEFLGTKNTKIMMDNFLTVDPDEARMKSVRVILVSANCSKSAVASPVQFIVSEGEDMRFLGELSKADQGMSSLTNLVSEHEKILRHALKFPRVQAVVYVTRSRHEAENESVVTRVLEYLNASNNNRGVPFRVTPPVLPFTSDQIDTGSSGVSGRYTKFLPSDKSNGCFVAIISREPEDPVDVARSAIARARSKGLLGKAKSATYQVSDDQKLDGPVTSSAGPRRNKAGGGRRLREAPSKPIGQKSVSAIGARLYQAGLAQRGDQRVDRRVNQVDFKPEHLKIIKHPAPFR